MITMSALPRLMECSGSAALAKAEAASVWADLGNDEHEDLSQLADLPPELARYVPPGARSEVKVAYDVATRMGRIIGEGSGRGYGNVGPFEIPGTIDVLGIDGDAVVIVDWKTGFHPVEPAERNWQLWGYAIAAASTLGKDRVIVRIVYTKMLRCDEYEIDALELAGFADRLEDLHRRVAALQVKQRSGEIISTHEGSWCRYCPSKPFCPTKNALLVQMSAGGLAVVGDAELSSDRATAAYRMIVRLETLVKDAKKRLEIYVDENGPIDLGDGMAYGRYSRKGNEKLDGDVVVRAIREVVGESAKEFEEIAIERSTSKAAIKRAAEKVVAKGAVTKLTNAVIGRTRLLGGITSEPTRPIGEFKLSEYEAAKPVEFPTDEVNKLLNGV